MFEGKARAQCYRFFSVIYKFLLKASESGVGKLLKPSLMFVGKAKSLP